MTDHELLEKAAKAAGVQQTYDDSGPYFIRPGCEFQQWNPLEDDGDALRLLNKLWLELRHVNGKAHVGGPGHFWCTESYGNDANDAATRRAIVRAAASLGERGKT